MSRPSCMEVPEDRVAIILVNWNGWRDTIECLDSLLASTTRGIHVFVVDNASTDGSCKHILEWLTQPARGENWSDFDGVGRISGRLPANPICFEVLDTTGTVIQGTQSPIVSLVHAGGNLGFAGGNNVGLKLALEQGFDWFWLLNSDTVVRHDTLPELLLRAQADSRCGIVGSSLIYYRTPDYVQAMGGRLNTKTTSVSHIGEGLPVAALPSDGAVVEKEMAYVVGASMLVSRRFLETVGLMQDDYFLYFEEIDWALRGRPEFTLGYAPRSWVFHKVGASSAKVMSEFSLNLLYRNRLRFVSRFLPERLWATKRSLAFEFLRHVLKGRWIPARLLFHVLFDSHAIEKSALKVNGLNNDYSTS